MSRRTVSIRFNEDGTLKAISPHAPPELRILAKILEADNLAHFKPKRPRAGRKPVQKP